jgi:hypothetical protein
MRRRRRAREIVYLVNLELEGIRHIMPHQLESRIPEQMRDVFLPPREKIVKADNIMPLPHELVAKMRA